MSLFGKPSGFGGLQTQGANPGFGAQPQNTVATFGGGFGQSSVGFGGTQQNSSSFGGQGWGANQNSTGFGAQGGQTQTGIGGGGGLFGSQGAQSQGFGQTQTGGGSFGKPNQSSMFQGGAQSFGTSFQTQGGFQPFGQQQQQPAQSNNGPLFSGQQQNTPGGLFGQPQNQAQNQGVGFGGQLTGMGANVQNPMMQQGGCKYNNLDPQQTVCSMNQQAFTFRLIDQEDNNKGKKKVQFENIRADDNFQLVSNQMLRLYDKLAQLKGQPQQNPEWICKQEFLKNRNAYPLIQKVMSQGQQSAQKGPNSAFPSATFSGPGFQQSQGFGQTSTGFGVQQTTLNFGQTPQSSSPFGQQQSTSFGLNFMPMGQQAKPQGSLFGSQPASTGLQGQQQPQSSMGFGGQSQGLFGQQPTGSSGGLFGQQTNPGQPTQSQGGLFQQQPIPGQPTQSQGGIFGQQPSGQTGIFSGQQQPQSSLFGGSQQPAQKPGGLFGGGIQQQQNGLFGAQSQQTQPAGGLFGPKQEVAGSTGTTSGLFGGGQQANTGGLFGANPAQPAQGGLFGQTQQQASSLFGATGQQQPSGGLFSGPQPAAQTSVGQGLFGGTSTQGQGLFAKPQGNGGLFGGTSGGLFGSQSTTQPQSQGGLFGQTQSSLFGQQTQPGTSLFGQQQPQQNPSGQSFGQSQSLFGGQQQAQTTQSLFGGAPPQPQQPVMANLFNFDQSDPLGVKSANLDLNNPFLSIDDEIAQMKKEAEAFRNRKKPISIFTALVDGDIGEGGISLKEIVDNGNIQGTVTFDLFKRDSAAEIEEEQRHLAEMESKYRQQNLQFLGRMRETGLKNTFNLSEGYRTQLTTSASTLRNKDFRIPQPYSRHSKLNELSQRSGRESEGSAKGVVNQREIFETQKKEVVTIVGKLEDNDLNPGKKELRVKIHLSYFVEDLRETVSKWLRGELGIEPSSFNLKFRGNQLHNDQSLKQAGLIGEVNEVSVDVERDLTLPNTHRQRKEILNESSLKLSAPAPQTHIDDRSFIPLPPLDGHFCDPPYSELCKMQMAELMRVKSFTIFNNLGKMEFIKPKGSGGLDLTFVDLSDFEILQKQVRGYKKSPETKPPVGQKLNVQTLVTLYNVDPPKNLSVEDIEFVLRASLKSSSEKNNMGDGEVAEFICYTYDQKHDNHEFVFRVPHYSDWGMDWDLIKKKQTFPLATVHSTDNGRKGVTKQEPVSNLKPAPALLQASMGETRMISKSRLRDLEIAKDEDSFSNQQNQSYQIKQPPPPPVYISAAKQRLLQRKEIMQKIQERRQFLIESETTGDSQSNRLQDSQEFQSQYPQSRQMTRISHRGCRPCFRVVQDKKGRQKQQIVTGHVSEDLKAHLFINDLSKSLPHDNKSSFREILLKHFHLTQVDTNRVLWEDEQMDSHSPFVSPICDQFMACFFQNLKLPQIRAKNDPKHIFEFLFDLAKVFINQIKSSPDHLISKETYSFYTICLLNALFGDPRLHLVQLHPQFNGGSRNLERLRLELERDGKSEFKEIRSQFGFQKLRRNAVTELLRFICRQEFPVLPILDSATTDEQIYYYTYRLLLNGQIVEAVRYLSKAGKNNLALILSRSLNPHQLTKNNIEGLVKQLGLNPNRNPCFYLIFDLIRERYNIQYNEDPVQVLRQYQDFTARQVTFIGKEQLSWINCLCSQLLFVFDPQITLTQAIQTFCKSNCFGLGSNQFRVQQDSQSVKQTDLLFTLLRYFGQSILPDEARQNISPFEIISKFKGVSLWSHQNQAPKLFQPSHDFLLKDFYLRWIVLQTVNFYNSFETQNIDRSALQNNMEVLGVITWNDMDSNSVKLVDQLTCQGQLEDALAFALCCIKNKQLRTKLVFGLGSKFWVNMNQSNNQQLKLRAQRLMVEELGIPERVFQVSRANFLQSNGHFDAALSEWMSVGNYQQAFQLFVDHIAPLYFESPQQIKALKTNILQTKRSQGNDVVVRKSGQLLYVEAILEILSKRCQQVEMDWSGKLREYEQILREINNQVME